MTGASGNVGTEVVLALQSFHPKTNIRIATRNTEDIKLSHAASEFVYLDFQNPDSFPSAVSGCTSVFLLRPPAISNTRETLNRFITTARDSGVERIVFLSVAGATDNKIVPHHAVEQQLRDGSNDWTILRPGFFAQNLASAYRDDIIQDHRLYVPAGSGQVAFVDLRNVGKVAAQTLTSVAEHAGMTYTLTGPKSYTFYEVADILSKNLGRTIEYVPASIPGYMYHLLRVKRLGVMQSIVQTVLHVGLRFGQAEEINPTLEQLLDEKPNNVETYIQDHIDIWK
ncbi:MAG: NAD(P)H-binding protein [Balneolaceae bacterium]|nr:NAD(P)H-binding protein [Balneolaceae bacterium]